MALASAPLAFVLGAVGVFMVAQACGGASGGADVAPTVTPEPTSSATSTPAETTGGGTESLVLWHANRVAVQLRSETYQATGETGPESIWHVANTG